MGRHFPVVLDEETGVMVLNRCGGVVTEVARVGRAQEQRGHARAGGVGGIAVEWIRLRESRAGGRRAGRVPSRRNAIGPAEAIVDAEFGSVAPGELSPG